MYRSYLIQAINRAGSQKGIGAVIGTKPSNINKWLNCNVAIPVEHALSIEVFTKGQIKAEDLSPDAKKQIQAFKRYLRLAYEQNSHHQTGIFSP